MNLQNSSPFRSIRFCPVLLLGLVFLIAMTTPASAQPGKKRGHSKHSGKFNRADLASSWQSNQAQHRSWKKSANAPVVPFAFYQPLFTPQYLAGDWQGFTPVVDYGYHRSMLGNVDSTHDWSFGSVSTPAYSDQAPMENAERFHQSLRPPIHPITPTSANDPFAYPTIHTKARARSAQHRAETAFRKGNYETASSLARQVVTLDSANGIAWLFAAQTCFAIGDYDQAASDLRTAIDLLPPQHWDFIVQNYQHFYGQNDFVRQMEQLNTFLIKRPLHVSARIVRGHQWAGLRHMDSAYNDLSIALSRRANDETILKLLERQLPVGLIAPQSDFIEQPAPWLNLPSEISSGNSRTEPIHNELFEDSTAAPGQPPLETLPAPDDYER
jgi:hypothetical protein